MSKILFDGFKIDSTMADADALLTKNLFWYDKVNGKLKIGGKDLNYYVDASNNKVLTTLTQAEATGLTIKPVEFTVIS